MTARFDAKLSQMLAQLAAEIGANKVLLQQMGMYPKLALIEKHARAYLSKPSKEPLDAMYDLIISYKAWGPSLPSTFPSIYQLMYEVGEMYLGGVG